MGYVKEMWITAVEKVGEDYAFQRISREEALLALSRFGFDRDEAEAMLYEAVS